ncbi:MAG: helix-turn-helix domain-containing protein [Polymorphobacter sp.]|uniref:helix-turn-helix domain-containing protein n=1 Tax=Polymorphobacter sp. TaxID=1909290 RepID=UPI003A8BA5A1
MTAMEATGATAKGAGKAKAAGGERDGNVRAISRGLAVLQTVNRGGSVTMMEICRGAEIPYPTACRIVQTLMDEGFLEREPARKRYRATAMVRTLALGFQEEDDLVAVSRPHIVALTKLLAWPVSITSRVGPMMMVRDSTHKLTSLTLHNYAPGFTLPIIECSTGKAWLAWARAEERAGVLAGLRQMEGPAERLAVLLTSSEKMLTDIRTKGYATQARNIYTATPGKTSSIAMPLFKDGVAIGALGLIFFASAFTMAEAEERFVPHIRETARAISAELGSGDVYPPVAV